ncbi:hypothetical protein [Sphingomonas sp. Y38-1Y]|uniref:hypothetical protein n=1 Tax=Sphingomonas sp. Y38-1Y TaxID=3078265 RepID=UPI0028ED9AB9|nr:hypothetical protein [Sphingomonas sp. Y38-1Y]
MAEDDRRMHEGDTPGLNPGRGHERHEEPVTAADAIGADDDNAPPDGPVGDVDAVGDGQDQDSALGGDVATQSGTGPTPEEERSRL